MHPTRKAAVTGEQAEEDARVLDAMHGGADDSSEDDAEYAPDSDSDDSDSGSDASDSGGSGDSGDDAAFAPSKQKKKPLKAKQKKTPQKKSPPVVTTSDDDDDADDDAMSDVSEVDVEKLPENMRKLVEMSRAEDAKVLPDDPDEDEEDESEEEDGEDDEDSMLDLDGPQYRSDHSSDKEDDDFVLRHPAEGDDDDDASDVADDCDADVGPGALLDANDRVVSALEKTFNDAVHWYVYTFYARINIIMEAQTPADKRSAAVLIKYKNAADDLVRLCEATANMAIATVKDTQMSFFIRRFLFSRSFTIFPLEGVCPNILNGVDSNLNTCPFTLERFTATGPMMPNIVHITSFNRKDNTETTSIYHLSTMATHILVGIHTLKFISEGIKRHIARHIKLDAARRPDKPPTTYVKEYLEGRMLYPTYLYEVFRRARMAVITGLGVPDYWTASH